MKSPEDCSSIEDVRDAIDELDRSIISTLGKRFAYVKAVTRFKRTEEDIQAPERYQAVLQTRREWAQDAGLSPDAIEKMYTDLIAHFIDEERKLLHVSPNSSQPEATTGNSTVSGSPNEMNDGGDATPL